jgi:chromosome segregation ATPase
MAATLEQVQQLDRRLTELTTLTTTAGTTLSNLTLEITGINTKSDNNVNAVNNQAEMITNLVQRLEAAENKITEQFTIFNKHESEQNTRISGTEHMQSSIIGALDAVKGMGPRDRTTGLRHEEAKHTIPKEWNSDAGQGVSKRAAYMKLKREHQVDPLHWQRTARRF